MDTVTVAILAILLIELVVLIWLVINARRSNRPDNSDKVTSTIELLKAELISRQAESLLSLRESIDRANKALNDRLAEGTGALDKRMSVFGEIENKLGQLATQAKNIEHIGNNINTLSDLLRPPKLRGNLGEMLLENLLAEILPQALFDTQYRFDSGKRVDAVIKLAGRIIPVDAKFPLEAFERLADNGDAATEKAFVQSLKKHVDDISTKYIRPDENTTEFAIMYIPAEAIYYRLISQVSQEGMDYALSKNVIPSSPGHLYAFLASISAVYSEMNMERAGLVDGSRKLVAGLAELSDILARLENLQDKMNGSLRSFTRNFEKARSETANLGYGLDKLRKPFPEDESAEMKEQP